MEPPQGYVLPPHLISTSFSHCNGLAPNKLHLFSLIFLIAFFDKRKVEKYFSQGEFESKWEKKLLKGKIETFGSIFESSRSSDGAGMLIRRSFSLVESSQQGANQERS